MTTQTEISGGPMSITGTNTTTAPPVTYTSPAAPPASPTPTTPATPTVPTTPATATFHYPTPVGQVDFILRNCHQVLTMPQNRGPVRSQPEDVGFMGLGRANPGVGSVEGDTKANQPPVAKATAQSQPPPATGSEAITIAACNGLITWIGPASQETAAGIVPAPHAVELDGSGLVVLPGLVDCHTHMIFAGDRSHEYHQRNMGITYQEIAASGGGIQATVDATRSTDKEELFRLAFQRLNRSMSYGVTSIEIKSGYGLDTESELKILEVAKRLGEEHPLTVVPTFLGAHAVPAPYRAEGRRHMYVDMVVNHMLPAVAARNLAQYCDVFVEEGAGAFSVDEARRIFQRAAQLGMTARLHADQFTNSGGARLAAELGAASADHLESAPPDDVIDGLRENGVTAVLLPGVTVFMGLNSWPSARRLLDGGVRVALATDCNPGSCHSENLLLMTTLACSYMKMTAEEALAGITVEGARSLGLLGQHGGGSARGTLLPGAWCDLACYRVEDYAHIPYRFGTLGAEIVVKEGQVVIMDGHPCPAVVPELQQPPQPHQQPFLPSHHGECPR